MSQLSEDDQSRITHFFSNNKSINEWIIYTKEQLTGTMLGRALKPRVHESFYSASFIPAQIENSPDPIFDDAYNLHSRYIIEFENHKYDHWSVRASTWASFLHEWETCLSMVCEMLPYYCCCDGGKELHRHMIVRYLEINWAQVKTSWRRLRNEDTYLYAKFRKPLSTRLHLIHTICYVSNIASQCIENELDSFNQFYCQDAYHGFKSWKTNKTKRGNCHFAISRPVPPFADLFFSLLYPTGLENWLQAKFKNTGVDSFAAEARRANGSGSWVVELKYLSGESKIVIPVKKYFDFVVINSNATMLKVNTTNNGNYLYLLKNKRVKLERKDGLVALTRKDWNKHQLQRGNNMMDVVANTCFQLGKKQQEILNVLERYLREKDEIIKQKDEIIRQKDETIREKDELIENHVKRSLKS